MPTNTTNNYFSKPAVGGDTDTWGTTLNANWDAVDSIVTGGTPISRLAISGSSAFTVGNSGKAVEGIDITATAGANNNYGGAISFGVGGVGRGAVAAVQNTADDDNIGLAFFSHGSPSTDDAVERMRIDSLGKVGIGTTSPTQALSVSAANNSQQITFGRTETSVGHGTIGADSTGAFGIWNSTDAKLVSVSQGGNVGIGYTSPDSKLDVAGVIKGGDVAATGGGTALSVKYTTGHTLNNFGAMYSGAETLIGFGVESHKSQANKFISTASNSNFTRGALTLDDELKFFNASATTTAVGSEVTMTERMRIDSSGHLLVGTTDTVIYNDNDSNSSGVVVQADGGVQIASYGGTPLFANRMLGHGILMSIRNSGTQVGYIWVNTNSTVYSTTSDERLKENIADSADAGSKIDAIQIRQFDWISNGEHQDYGVIAQELIEVAPEAVAEGDTEEDMMGVDYSKLVPLLVKEVQSLRSRVAALESA